MSFLRIGFSSAMLAMGLVTAHADVTEKSVETSAADRAWADLQREEQRDYPADINSWTPTRRVEWVEAATRTLHERALAFYTGHPTDPRRWHAVVLLLKHRRGFVKGFKPGYDDDPTPDRFVVDEVARAHWERRLAQIEAQMANATDVPAEVREARAALALNPDVFRAFTGRFDGDWSELGRRVERFVAEFPESRQSTGFESRYMNALATHDPAAAEARARRVAAESPSANVRAQASEWLRAAAERGKVVDLRFTALDGREVDMRELRGKVVLIDFWATWCGPCIKELPNVKQAYADFHAAGFEIIGISLDKEGDRQTLVDFVAKEQMPWPQHFDGRHWKNEFAVRYGIKGIPAMFLVDREGRIVATDVRGERLHSEVKRLLGEPQRKALGGI